MSSVAISRLYQQLAMFLILVLTARSLGPDGRGLLASAIAWVQLAGTAAGLSLGKVAFEQSAAGGRENWDAGLVQAMVTIATAILAVLFAVGFCAAVWLGPPPFAEASSILWVFIVVSVPFYIWEDYALYLFTLRSRLTQNFRIVSLGRTLSVAFVLLLVTVLDLALSGALIAVLAGQAASSVWTFCIVRREMIGRSALNKNIVADLFKKGLKLHPQTLAMMLFGTSDVVLLHAFRGGAEAAYYQAAWALVAIPVFASTPMGNVFYQLIAERGPDGAWVTQRKLVIVAVGAAAAIGIVAAWVVPLAIPLIFGPAFEPSSAIFLGLLPFGMARVLTNLITPQWIARGLFTQFSVATVAIALVTLAVNLLLIPDLGASGAVQASWIAAFGLVATNLALAVWISTRSSGVGPRDSVQSK